MVLSSWSSMRQLYQDPKLLRHHSRPGIDSDLRFSDGGWCGGDFFRHLTGMVVGNLPLTIFKDVDEGVSGLDFCTSGTQRKLIDTNILAPVGTNFNKGFQDNSM